MAGTSPAMTVSVIAAICLLTSFARADENSDLNMIPGTIGQQPVNPSPEGAPGAPAPPAPSPTAAAGKLYIEDDFAANSYRSPLAVPLPRSTTRALDLQNRASLDFTRTWTLGDGLQGTLSDRGNLFAENDIAIPSHQDFRNDFREGYLTWKPVGETYLEAGRINVRNGVALGYNPTDFFKTRTPVSQSSEDPSVIREDRLGVAMVQGQRLFEGGSISLAFAPRLESPVAMPTSGMPPSVDPGFGRTNGQNRTLLSGSYEIADGVSPEFLVYHEDGNTRLGANVSRTIGQAVVVYGEWAGGQQAPLSSRAIEFGKLTHVLPAAVPDADPRRSFANDAALGASWTDGVDEITLNLEYHYHQTGFSADQWRNWFAAGAAHNNSTDSLLWFARAYASDQQEPMTQQEFFLRADWNDAIVQHLELSAIAFVDAYDGSVLTQFSASYYLSDNWTLGGLAGASVGASRSERGSLPEQASVIAQLVHYF